MADFSATLLEALWGSQACDLRDRLMNAKSLAHKFSIVDAALLHNVRRSLQRHPAVDFALHQFERLPHAKVAAIIDDVGLSSRRFIELFRDQVGLTPKMYCRVRRFQRMLDLIETSSNVEWAESALDCGYYDQAHFIHEFQAFSNLAPSDYLRVRGRHLNHVPIP